MQTLDDLQWLVQMPRALPRPHLTTSAHIQPHPLGWGWKQRLDLFGASLWQGILSPRPFLAPQGKISSVQHAGDISETSRKRWPLSCIRKPSEEFPR